MTKEISTYKEVVEEMISLRDFIMQCFKKSSFPEEDLRSRIFLNIEGQLGNIISFLNVLLCMQEGIIPPEKYITYFGLVDKGKGPLLARKLSMYMRLSLITMFQFQVENYFVNVLYALKPQEKPPPSYMSAMRKLIDNLSISEKQEKKDILTILQYMRNTLHSNGIHNNRNFSKKLDGFVFEFERGKKINCASWVGIPIAIRNVIKIIEEVNHSSKIMKIQELVKDQYIEPE